MRDRGSFWGCRADWFSSVGREQRIQDYLAQANALVWQRQGSFFAAAMLSAIYIDAISTLICYSAVVITEIGDQLLERRARSWDGHDPVFGREILMRIACNTVLSSAAISVFIGNIALQNSSSNHFTSLFFLFSASIFAAMYNSQMVGILLLRLFFYALCFLFIALLNIFPFFPPLSSRIWLEFFTIIFVLYFIFDVSMKFYRSYQERVEHIKLIERENELSKAALLAKSQFLSTVSHELRTPLTSIVGSLELLKNGVLGELPETARPTIGIAVRNGQRLANLVDDLLDLQRVEAGEMLFEFEPIDVNYLVNEAVDSATGYAKKFGIQIVTNIFSVDCRIRGDRNRLVQVMNNLLSNAVKFSEEGSTVTVGVETQGSRIRIAVEDRGAGIPEDAGERVFDKFSQVDSSDTRKVGGTGLGLNITREILKHHDATIDYVSELGVGSTFFIEFKCLTEGEGGIASHKSVADVA